MKGEEEQTEVPNPGEKHEQRPWGRQEVRKKRRSLGRSVKTREAGEDTGQIHGLFLPTAFPGFSLCPARNRDKDRTGVWQTVKWNPLWRYGASSRR